MDVMKFESNFAKHVLSKILAKYITKHTGAIIGVRIQTVDFKNDEKEGEAELHLDITFAAPSSELHSVLQKIGFA